MSFKSKVALCGVLAFTACLPIAQAQQKVSDKQTQDANLKTYVNLLRADINKAKVSILSELMDLSPEDAARFWPAYNEYSKALTKLADERLASIKMYAENYTRMTDEKITEIARSILDIEGRRTDLKKSTFEKMSQTCSPKLAARFLQIESQIEKLLDLQLASSLPIVE